MVDREITSDPVPPFSDELLADLHAGNLDPALAARLWPVVRSDPASVEVIEALDNVVALLAARGSDLDAEAVTPDWVRDKLDGTLPSSRQRWYSSRSAMIGLAAAAVVIVAAVVGVGTLTPTPDTAPVQADGKYDGIEGAMVTGTIGSYTAGRLADPEILRECLDANGIDPSTALLGSSPVTIDGRRATLLIVPGPVAPTITAIAVGDDCGPGSPDTVSRREVG